jgi:hypothetical protein
MSRKKIAPWTAVEVLFTPDERSLVLEHMFASPNLTGRLRMAPIKGAKLAVRYTLVDLDELVGYVAAEARYSEDMKLQGRLDALFARLTKERESYDDGGWQESF